MVRSLLHATSEFHHLDQSAPPPLARRISHTAAANRETNSKQSTTAAELVKKLSLELNERARDLPAYELQKCQRVCSFSDSTDSRE